MRKLFVFFGVAVMAMSALLPAARADRPPTRTFITVMTAAQERPTCAPATKADLGLAVFHVDDQATGKVSFLLVTTDLPGSIIAAHIHIAPKGTPGPIVQPLPPTPGVERGVIAHGTFVNPDLLAKIQADPGSYYVNVHTDVCMSGVIRGQLFDLHPFSR